MKLTFAGTLNEKEVFIDADAGKPDHQNQQAITPIRLSQGVEQLPTAQRNQVIDRFFDNSNSRATMLGEMGIPEDEIT